MQMNVTVTGNSRLEMCKALVALAFEINKNEELEGSVAEANSVASFEMVSTSVDEAIDYSADDDGGEDFSVDRIKTAQK